jgi:hypothetical protein
LVIGVNAAVVAMLAFIQMLPGFRPTTAHMAYVAYSSFCCAQPFLGIAGIVVGSIALRETDGARHFAVWGIALSVLTVIVFVIELVIGFVYVYFSPNFLRHMVG